MFSEFLKNLFKIGKSEPEEMFKMKVFWKQVDCATFIVDLCALEAIVKSREAKKKGCTMSEVFGTGILPAVTNKVVFVNVDKKTMIEIQKDIDSGKFQGISSFEMAA